MPHRLWTTQRKLMGNVIPAVLSSPFAVVAIHKLLQNPKYGIWTAATWMSLAVVSGWIAVNFFGLWGNSKMKSALKRRLQVEEIQLPEDAWFVGMATPSYVNSLDPHEDVGFLVTSHENVCFYGDSKRITLPKTSISRIERRRNIHSWVGLGGWISIEATLEGKPVRMLIEPRIHNVLLKNRREAKRVTAALVGWLNQSGSTDS